MTDEQAISALRALLESPHWTTRMAAVYGLSYHPGAWDRIAGWLERVERDDPHEMVRMVAGSLRTLAAED